MLLHCHLMIVLSFQFMTLLSEEGDDASSDRLDKELALTKTVDATVVSMDRTPDSKEPDSESHENKMRSQDNLCIVGATSPVVDSKPHETTESSASHVSIDRVPSMGTEVETSEQPLEEANLISYQRKVTVLYTLLSACVADTAEVDKKCSRSRKGYDARHRVALRLLATWLQVNWIEMVRELETLLISSTILHIKLGYL